MPPRPAIFVPLIITLVLLGFLRTPSAADGTFFPIERTRDLAYFPAAARAPGQIVPSDAARFLPITRTGAQAGLPVRRAPAQRQIGAAGGLPPVVVRTHPASLGVAAALSAPAPARVLEAAVHAPLIDGVAPADQPAATGGGYAWPVDLATPSRITSGFGWRADPFTGKAAFHGAIDIAAPDGARVVATANGVVQAVGEHPRLGRYIMLAHNDGSLATYGHLKSYTVGTGQMVRRGQAIGLVGSTGRSTGPHVDFRLEIDGRRIDPLPLLRRPATIAAR